MRTVLRHLIAGTLLWFASVQAAERNAQVLLVRGANGTDAYGAKFDAQINAWQEACAKGALPCTTLTTRDALQTHLSAEAAKSTGTLWIVLIGHGTFDGRESKFNLAGPDLSAAQFADWVKPVQHEVVVVNMASASGAFVQPLAGPKRVIVCATKSGTEIYYARFGEFMAKAMTGLAEADLDQDQQVSVLEGFLYASKQVAQFYENEGRIATEHALLEDNGDGVGTRAESFEGVRAKEAKADGARALQLALVLNEEERKLSEDIRAKRDALETKVRALVARKGELKQDDYYRELEQLFVEIAKLQP